MTAGSTGTPDAPGNDVNHRDQHPRTTVEAHRLETPADRDAPARSRAFVEAQMAALACEPSPEVVLLTSEVVTNVVSHTTTASLQLELRADDRVLRVEVWDDDASAPVLAPRDPGTPGGFGLRMVDQLAERWGVIHDPAGGKRVWFELPRPTP